jgi:hypothetical protein
MISWEGRFAMPISMESTFGIYISTDKIRWNAAIARAAFPGDGREDISISHVLADASLTTRHFEVIGRRQSFLGGRMMVTRLLPR